MDQNASTNKQVELDKAGILHASVAEAELDKVSIVSLGTIFGALWCDGAGGWHVQ
jgi:hypothetical protein